MTIEQLYDFIKIQQEEIAQLRIELQYLKEISDLNDYQLREMIDALTESVDGIMDDHCCCDKYKINHSERKAREKLEKENREDA